MRIPVAVVHDCYGCVAKIRWVEFTASGYAATAQYAAFMKGRLRPKKFVVKDEPAFNLFILYGLFDITRVKGDGAPANECVQVIADRVLPELEYCTNGARRRAYRCLDFKTARSARFWVFSYKGTVTQMSFEELYNLASSGVSLGNVNILPEQQLLYFAHQLDTITCEDRLELDDGRHAAVALSMMQLCGTTKISSISEPTVTFPACCPAQRITNIAPSVQNILWQGFAVSAFLRMRLARLNVVRAPTVCCSFSVSCNVIQHLVLPQCIRDYGYYSCGLAVDVSCIEDEELAVVSATHMGGMMFIVNKLPNCRSLMLPLSEGATEMHSNVSIGSCPQLRQLTLYGQGSAKRVSRLELSIEEVVTPLQIDIKAHIDDFFLRVGTSSAPVKVRVLSAKTFLKRVGPLVEVVMQE